MFVFVLATSPLPVQVIAGYGLAFFVYIFLINRTGSILLRSDFLVLKTPISRITVLYEDIEDFVLYPDPSTLPYFNRAAAEYSIRINLRRRRWEIFFFLVPLLIPTRTLLFPLSDEDTIRFASALRQRIQ
jgi:hypothetical protein